MAYGQSVSLTEQDQKKRAKALENRYRFVIHTDKTATNTDTKPFRYVNKYGAAGILRSFKGNISDLFEDQIAAEAEAAAAAAAVVNMDTIYKSDSHDDYVDEAATEEMKSDPTDETNTELNSDNIVSNRIERKSLLNKFVGDDGGYAGENYLPYITAPSHIMLVARSSSENNYGEDIIDITIATQTSVDRLHQVPLNYFLTPNFFFLDLTSFCF